MLHKYFYKYQLSFRKRKFAEAELDFLQMNHMRLIDLMSNSELSIVMKRIGKFKSCKKLNYLIKCVRHKLYRIKALEA